MKRFEDFTGIAALIARDDIDTDTIIPVPFLRNANRALGHALFHDLRFDVDRRERPNFILNRPGFRLASILVAGRNFGCGSSREHAVWALQDYGIKAVVAESFGEIFFRNSLLMGLLVIALDPDRLHHLHLSLEGAEPQPVDISLTDQKITMADGSSHAFRIDPAHRTMLLEGLDAIQVTQREEERIDRFQNADRAARPWVYELDLDAI